MLRIRITRKENLRLTPLSLLSVPLVTVELFRWEAAFAKSWLGFRVYFPLDLCRHSVEVE